MSETTPPPHRRRPRYTGTYPRRFHEKYKEHAPEQFPDTVAKVLASGKTPAGAHVPVLVAEVFDILAPRPGERVVDCTLGYGGHARELLRRILPGGMLLGLDVDPLELPRTEARLRGLGFAPEAFITRRSNFAGLPKVLADTGWTGADCILADLGVSSMQLDTPGRGFSSKAPGPLDMRMNPNRGQPASALLQKVSPDDLAAILTDNADEPQARILAEALAGQAFADTTDLSRAITAALPLAPSDDQALAVRRVFQALRIAVNDEFAALDTFLRHLPACLSPGGRAAILTFHSGEDRRVKKAFQAGLRDGSYSAVADTVVRPGPAERRANPRAT
ncbi:MAG: 16S rRNA (cytosine(1402)-N(4))-methyltransferase RsmH, partial [Vicinamibacterales bacterium]|nr:16S rRNA (cytosine(1402)-N(4))-methyltransferase RsmH [Vicinamibacterales bacterium]